MAKLITAADIDFQFIEDLLDDASWMFKTVEVMAMTMTDQVWNSEASSQKLFDFEEKEWEEQVVRDYLSGSYRS